MGKHEVYVKALLEYYSELYEKRHLGLYHLSDEMLDLETAIERSDLTSKQHEVLVKYFFESKNQKDIASELECGQDVVSRRIQSTVKKIANIYEQWEALEHVS